LEAELLKTPSVKITQVVDANSIFAIVPPAIIPELQKEHFFYVWNEKTSEVRLMCSFDTTEDEIRNFGKKLRELSR
jgi:threonine aldolase